MVHYEVALILRALPKVDLPKALHAAASVVLQQGGVIQQMQNLGEKALPYRMDAHGEKFTDGRYILLKVNAPPGAVKTIHTKLRGCKPVIRASMLKLDNV